MLRDRPDIVQRSSPLSLKRVYFCRENPEPRRPLLKRCGPKTKKGFRHQDVYAREIVDRRMTIPDRGVADTIEQARQSGINVRTKPEDLYDNSFTAQLEKSGFLKELWGNELSTSGR
jgi:hypothetical protein